MIKKEKKALHDKICAELTSYENSGNDEEINYGFLEEFYTLLVRVKNEWEEELADNDTKRIDKTFVKLKDEIPMEKMGANYPGPDSEKQFLYGDVVDWLRDQGYGKDHLLALLLVGHYAVKHFYDGNKNNE